MASKNFKLYYSAKEVAELLDEDISNIYYWEKAYNLKLPTSKTSARKRFRHEDIELMRKIKHLIRDKKLTSDGVKAALAFGDQEEIDRKAKALQHLKEALSTVEAMIQQVDTYRMKSQKRKLPEDPILHSSKKLFDEE